VAPNREVAGGGHWAQKVLVIAQAQYRWCCQCGSDAGRQSAHLEHQNFGFDPDGRYLASISSPCGELYSRRQLVRFIVRFKTGLSALPGVHRRPVPRRMRR